MTVGFVDSFAEADDQVKTDDEEAESPADESATWDGPVVEPPEPPRQAFRGVWRAGWQHLDISGLVDPAWLTQMLGDMENRAAEARGWDAGRASASKRSHRPTFRTIGFTI